MIVMKQQIILLLLCLLTSSSYAFSVSSTIVPLKGGSRHPNSVKHSAKIDGLDSSSNTNAKFLEPFGVGVKRDFGNRIPQYKSDILDGLNAQSLATTLFLFFACLAPAIGFGSVLGSATGNTMGVIEMVASTSLSGVLYALFSAQPVQLIGPQGPVISYIAALFHLAQYLQVPFLALYTWVGK